jgi:putative transposase
MLLDLATIPGEPPHPSDLSTKNRDPLLVDKDLRQRTHAYLATVLKDIQCPALIVGGVADHVHILCQLAKTQPVSDIVEHLKTS